MFALRASWPAQYDGQRKEYMPQTPTIQSAIHLTLQQMEPHDVHTVAAFPALLFISGIRTHCDMCPSCKKIWTEAVHQSKQLGPKLAGLEELCGTA